MIENTPLPASNNLLEQLKQLGLLDDEQISQIKRRMKRASCADHRAIIDLGFLSQEDVYRTLAGCLGLEFVILRTLDLQQEATDKVPAKVALHYNFVPIELSNNTLKAAFSSPPSLQDGQNLRLLLGIRLEPVIASPVEIHRILKQVYGLGAETVLQLRQDKAFQKNLSMVTFEEEGQNLDSVETQEDASIVHLVNQILLEALAFGTTDIHIEPFPETVKVRYRVDGMLRDIPTPPGIRELHEAIVSRLKIMADLNIAEKRLPHDGRIKVTIRNESFDLRVSILPTRFGETLCLRILNRSSIFLEMDQLGMNKEQLAILNRLIEMPHGILLVTGPTGSGKTTTLYACLNKVKQNSPERKIITVEDPVEYELVGISQIQIRSDIGLTFASGLRSILRHDPDIILVGEIRDSETAEIAIRSALTGHLVLSTLHTNDSVGAVNRLVDMGVEPYLVASSLVASMAQRLVRRICPHCKVPQQELRPRIREEIAASLGMEKEEVITYIGEGCIECDQTGYRGRLAILEIFLLDELIQDMVSRHATSTELRRVARDNGMRTLRDAGWEKVVAGLTSVKEITRITSAMDLSYAALTDK